MLTNSDFMENPFVNFVIVRLSLLSQWQIFGTGNLSTGVSLCSGEYPIPSVSHPMSEFGLLLDKIIAHTICRTEFKFITCIMKKRKSSIEKFVL